MVENPTKFVTVISGMFLRRRCWKQKAERSENRFRHFFKRAPTIGLFFRLIYRGVFCANEKSMPFCMEHALPECFCKNLLILCGLNDCIDERKFLFAGTVQVADVADHGVCVRGGCARHEFALPFGRRGFMHDDADTFPSLDSATPPEWSMIWRSACPA